MLEITLLPQMDRIPIEAECLAVDRLCELKTAEIERLPVYVGNRKVVLGDLCTVQGDASDAMVHLLGNWSAVKHVGTRMSRGHLEIHGNAGMHLGAEMSGGKIVLHGDAGDWAGAHLAGGLIHIKGSAGNLAGGAYRGNRTGMRGGTILIEKDAGDEVGCGMRRGLIAVAGRCGEFAGVSMVAGSLLLFGQTGRRLGAGMQRGTIGLLCSTEEQPELLPTFKYDCDYLPTFLNLYLRQLAQWGFPVLRDYLREGFFRRYNGDLLELGKGEVLAWQG